MGVSARPDKNGKYHNKVGRYFPLHPEKYKGQSELVFKSDLERLMMLYLDKNPNVIQWIYEPFSIKYLDESTNKIRRYYMDFVAVVKDNDHLKTIWIEVKSKKETTPPKDKKNLKELATWIKNQSKWKQAKKLASERGHNFVIITENELH